MAKGKKQKKSGASKQEEPPSVSGLSLEESAETAAPSDAAEPSTSSTTAAAPAPEEEEGGLGLGPSKSRKKKKAIAASPAEVAEVAQPPPPNPTIPAPAPEPGQKEEDDEGGLGLGLGKSRNKKKRKPKSATAAAGGSSEQSKESTPAPSEQPAPEQRTTGWGPQKPASQPLQAAPSQPPVFTQAGPPGFPAAVPSGFAPPSQFGPPQGFPGPGGLPQGFPGPGGLPQGFPGPGGPQQGFPGPGGPQQGFPGPGGPQQRFPGPGGPQQGFPGPGGPQQGFPGQGGPQQGFPGLGGPPQHGFPAPGAPPQGFPGPGGPQQGFPGPGGPQQGFPGPGGPQQGFPGPGGPQQGFPGPGGPQQGFPAPGGPPQATAPPGWQQRSAGAGAGRGQGRDQAPKTAAPVQHVTSHGDVRRSPDTTVCRFVIPEKIIGKSVRARPITVLANYLPMTIQPLKIHRYDVTFKPDKPKKMIPRAFIAAKGRLYPKHFIAFDQMKNCYSLKPLPNVTGSERFATVVELQDNNNKKMSFEVSFKSTGTVDLGTIMNHMRNGGSSLSPPTEAIQCVDVILRQGTLESYIKAGRQFFKRPDRPIDLGDGLEMWTGLFQSAIFTYRPFINIDVAHKGFPRQQRMIDAITRDFGLDLQTPIDRQRSRGVESFRLFIKNLRVVASIGGDCTSKGQRREFICNDLVDPPSKITFTLNENGKEVKMTVADYFAKVKKVRLQYPNLNCMWVGPRDKKIYYPMELLQVSYGQVQNKQLNEKQLSTMVREAASPPDDRKRKIEEVIRDMNYSRNEYFKAFGMEIQNEFIKVEAKVLQAPNLDVGDRRPVQPSRGAWQTNKLLKPEPLESWAIISIEVDVAKCQGENVVQLLKSQGNQMGMRVAEPRERYYNIQMTKLHSVLFEALKNQIRFLVIIVPTWGRDYYHRVKQIAERDIGILTQCIKEFTAARKMSPQTAKNILLKVNSKLMGINQALDKSSLPLCLQAGNVMVVGADVTHPSPDQTSLPSIAAVTASIDPKAFMYNIQLSIQTPKKEMIVEFEDMMVEHLKVYRDRQRGLPKKIFVFRDGVSEGQFSQVMESELQAVHRAYQRMTGDNTKPEVLFLLVQKRHHTRFFNPDPRSAQYNVEPGTVVDQHIVHAKELDFYLVSHQAIKGTARPTRYHAVCNDGKIPHDEVEQLTYYLCHLYSRCMRSVSYPTPTYYAHLACLRARSLTHGEKFDNQALERNPKRLNVLDKMLEFSRMFFV